MKAERERAAAALKQIRQEQERKKREEERIQQKLRNLGVCIQGYQWIRQPTGGYHCAGGFHFVFDIQLRQPTCSIQPPEWIDGSRSRQVWHMQCVHLCNIPSDLLA